MGTTRDVTRVCLVLPSFAGGGAERVMLTLASRLDRERFSISLVVLSAKGPLQSAVPTDVEPIDLKEPRLRAALPKLFSTLRAQKPAIVMTTMGYMNLGLLVGGRIGAGGARLVVREANMPEATLNAVGWGGLGRLAYRLLYRRADAVVCNARRVGDALQALGVTKAALHVIPNPVDVEHLRGSGAPVRHPGPGRRFVAVGRLTEQKGFDRLIPVMSALDPEDHVTILGDGPMRDSLARSIQQVGLETRMSMPGFSERPWPTMAGADALLMPSRWEGLPNAALESLAVGTPVIGWSSAGGLTELTNLVREGGIVIADSEEAFAGAAARIAATPDRTAHNPSLLPEAFSVDTVVETYASLFSHLVAKG